MNIQFKFKTSSCDVFVEQEDETNYSVLQFKSINQFCNGNSEKQIDAFVFARLPEEG